MLGTVMTVESHAQNGVPSLLDVVALPTDRPAHGLARGQVGTTWRQAWLGVQRRTWRAYAVLAGLVLGVRNPIWYTEPAITDCSTKGAEDRSPFILAIAPICRISNVGTHDRRTGTPIVPGGNLFGLEAEGAYPQLVGIVPAGRVKAKAHFWESFRIQSEKNDLASL